MASTPTTKAEQHDAPPPAAPKPDPAAAKQAADERAWGSIGAQVILDFNSDAGKAARGGFSADMQANVDARDANLIALGLNPSGPSGPPTGTPWEPPPPAASRSAPAVSGAATRVSSLAAGITAPGAEPAKT